MFELQSPSASPADVLWADEVTEVLRRLLGRLPDLDDWIVREVKLEGIPVKVVARSLGLSASAVYKRLSRAIETLRLYLERCSGERNIF